MVLVFDICSFLMPRPHVPACFGFTIVLPNHWLVTQRMYMLYNALERHAAAVRQLCNGTIGNDLYIHIATVGNTIQTVNSLMYDTYMSTPGNAANPRAIHSNIQTAQSNPSLVGRGPTMHESAHH